MYRVRSWLHKVDLVHLLQNFSCSLGLKSTVVCACSKDYTQKVRISWCTQSQKAKIHCCLCMQHISFVFLDAHSHRILHDNTQAVVYNLLASSLESFLLNLVAIVAGGDGVRVVLDVTNDDLVSTREGKWLKGVIGCTGMDYNRTSYKSLHSNEMLFTQRGQQLHLDTWHVKEPACSLVCTVKLRFLALLVDYMSCTLSCFVP